MRLVLYGSAVAKYRYNPEAVKLAEEEQRKAEQEAIAVAGGRQEARRRGEGRTSREEDGSREYRESRGRQAEVGRGRQGGRRQSMKAATTAATPKDIVDIVVAELIRILVTPGDQK